MSFAFLEDLLVVTIINFVVVFSSTIAILYSVDKLKEKYGKKDKDEQFASFGLHHPDSIVPFYQWNVLTIDEYLCAFVAQPDRASAF